VFKRVKCQTTNSNIIIKIEQLQCVYTCMILYTEFFWQKILDSHCITIYSSSSVNVARAIQDDICLYSPVALMVQVSPRIVRVAVSEAEKIRCADGSR
jgi:hypothetical protein